MNNKQEASEPVIDAVAPARAMGYEKNAKFMRRALNRGCLWAAAPVDAIKTHFNGVELG